ncbi:AraC family transcriptional regulator [Geodermatophilus sp. CPCC 206100]|uniref:AraC family transcriptional regulator n=1 Tax=Geodermatophilus sp. CPCC 206100 TaxID=3020054 RepID=UPI003B00A6CC
MDLLSAVLQELRLTSAAYRSLELHAPWRLRFDGGLRGVHVVVSGNCTLRVDGQAPLDLRPGDLVVLPRADSHELASAQALGVPPVSALDLARRTQGNRIVVGGAGEVTTIVCGAFSFGDEDHPAVAGFPPCILVPGHEGRSPEWLAGLTAALATETLEGGPGSEVVMARLSDALVTRALRHHLETTDEVGWLQGLRDPHLATALAALHADLAAPWTLERLARSAGLSRSAFAARFAATVGQPPMQYLYRSRMRRAITMLRAGDTTNASIAARVGYGSEAAFAAAFTRHTGVPPGAYRRRGNGLPQPPAPRQPGTSPADTGVRPAPRTGGTTAAPAEGVGFEPTMGLTP